MHTVDKYHNIALLGAWASNVDSIMKGLNHLSDAEKGQILKTSLLLDIKRVAARVGESFSSPHAFSQQQAYDIGLDTGTLPVMSILQMLSHNAATDDDARTLLRTGKYHKNLRTAQNVLIANNITKLIAGENASQKDKENNALLRAFIAQRTVMANRWLNLAHRSAKDRLLSVAEWRIAFWTTLGIELEVGKISCKHCNAENVQIFEHAECCPKSRRRTNTDGKLVYPKRSTILHTHLMKTMTHHFRMIPDLTLSSLNTKITDVFQPNPENPPTIAANRTEAAKEKGDLMYSLAYGNIQEEMLLDHTVAGIHSVANKQFTINEDGYTSSLPNHAEHKKDLKHDHYLHDGKAYGLAMDSAGGTSKSTDKIFNLFYGKGTANNPRNWNSESMRIALKKNFLDTMSCVIMKHRVRDYAKLGLPNARMRGQQQPHAQGGAQNINIVNNIGEDAQQVAAV